MEQIPGIETMVREMVELHRQTHEKVSEELQKMFPGRRGLSSCSSLQNMEWDSYVFQCWSASGYDIWD